jgi:hypothetical protein
MPPLPGTLGKLVTAIDDSSFPQRPGGQGHHPARQKSTPIIGRGEGRKTLHTGDPKFRLGASIKHSEKPEGNWAQVTRALSGADRPDSFRGGGRSANYDFCPLRGNWRYHRRARNWVGVDHAFQAVDVPQQVRRNHVERLALGHDAAALHHHQAIPVSGGLGDIVQH